MKQLLWLLVLNSALIADSVKQSARSFQEIEKSARSGDGYAQYQLAAIYENGSGMVAVVCKFCPFSGNELQTLILDNHSQYT